MTATTAAATTAIQGTPQIRPMPNEPWYAGGTLGTFRPPVISCAAPSAMPSVPSVTMKGGTCHRTETYPLTHPHADPATTPPTTPAAMPSAMWGNCRFAACVEEAEILDTSSAEIPAEKTTNEPHDRSIPPAIMMNVSPAARSRISEVFAPSDVKLFTDRNRCPGDTMLKMAISTRSTPRMRTFGDLAAS